MKKLYRNIEDRKVAGVCSGLADSFDLDPLLVRIIVVAATLGGGFGLFFYLIAWIFVPVKSSG